MGTVDVVLDTNVVISAVGWNSKPERCVCRALSSESGVELHVSAETLAELSRVVEYQRLGFSLEERLGILLAVWMGATIQDPDVDLEVVDDDPDDDMFLECAVAADADYVVSGDDHLKNLGSFRGIDILPPAEFLNEIE